MPITFFTFCIWESQLQVRHPFSPAARSRVIWRLRRSCLWWIPWFAREVSSLNAGQKHEGWQPHCHSRYCWWLPIRTWILVFRCRIGQQFRRAPWHYWEWFSIRQCKGTSELRSTPRTWFSPVWCTLPPCLSSRGVASSGTWLQSRGIDSRIACVRGLGAPLAHPRWRWSLSSLGSRSSSSGPMSVSIWAALDCVARKARSNKSHWVSGRHRIHRKCKGSFSWLGQRGRNDLKAPSNSGFNTVTLGYSPRLPDSRASWHHCAMPTLSSLSRQRTTTPHQPCTDRSRCEGCQCTRQTNKWSFRESAEHVSLLAKVPAFQKDLWGSKFQFGSWRNRNRSIV